MNTIRVQLCCQHNSKSHSHKYAQIVESIQKLQISAKPWISTKHNDINGHIRSAGNDPTFFSTWPQFTLQSLVRNFATLPSLKLSQIMYQTRRFNSKKSGKTSLAFEHRPRLFCPIETEKSLTQTTIQKSTLLLPVQMSTLYIPKIPRLSSLASIRAFNDANFLLKPRNPMSVVETWHERYRNHRIFVSTTKQKYGSPDQLTWTQLRLRYTRLYYTSYYPSSQRVKSHWKWLHYNISFISANRIYYISVSTQRMQHFRRI